MSRATHTTRSNKTLKKSEKRSGRQACECNLPTSVKILLIGVGRSYAANPMGKRNRQRQHTMYAHIDIHMFAMYICIWDKNRMSTTRGLQAPISRQCARIGPTSRGKYAARVFFTNTFAWADSPRLVRLVTFKKRIFSFIESYESHESWAIWLHRCIGKNGTRATFPTTRGLRKPISEQRAPVGPRTPPKDAPRPIFT